MNRREFVEFVAMAPLMASFSKPGPNDVPSGKLLVLLPDSARQYDIGHGKAHIIVGAEQSAGAWWFGSFLSDQGRKTSLHVHHAMDEMFYVLKGVLSVWVEGGWKNLPAGALAAVPRGLPHALGNRSHHPVQFLGSGNAGGFEGFFADIEAISRRLEYGSREFFIELKKVYTKYDSELLGPPPED